MIHIISMHGVNFADILSDYDKHSKSVYLFPSHSYINVAFFSRYDLEFIVRRFPSDIIIIFLYNNFSNGQREIRTSVSLIQVIPS